MNKTRNYIRENLQTVEPQEGGVYQMLHKSEVETAAEISHLEGQYYELSWIISTVTLTLEDTRKLNDRRLEIMEKIKRIPE